MIREVDTMLITKAVKELCIKATHELSPDMAKALHEAREKETKPLAKEILEQLEENLRIAKRERIPICQDTGMAVLFVEVGQDVHFVGENVGEAIQKGVRAGYEEGYLRKSVVADPLLRENTGDNTPAIIHYELVPGDKVHITFTAKGFGSENMSRICMLKPADGEEGVMEQIVETVRLAGPNACPPLVIGVGLGGDFELAAKMAKHALTLPVTERAAKPHIRRIEEETLRRINALQIGPAGLSGDTTAFALHIETYPTHIAGMPLAVNICCHVNRHESVWI
ncbi:fumarate hydratase subunit alpha [Lachnospiraceae bacterium XBB1006]|nr:fumarate hydratase subunit alpha [Lachnospiraceae bacterium XBB1006]